MPTVTFFPEGKSGEVSEDISLLDAAERLGVTLRHDCGGFATCSTCRVWIAEGMPNLSAVDLDEENMLEEAALTAPYRLSCQARVRGDVAACIEAPEMDWTTGALRDLDALPAAIKKIVRLMVEQRARRAGIAAILPDTSIPYVAQAREEVEAIAGDPAGLAALIRRVYMEA